MSHDLIYRNLLYTHTHTHTHTLQLDNRIFPEFRKV